MAFVLRKIAWILIESTRLEFAGFVGSLFRGFLSFGVGSNIDYFPFRLDPAVIVREAGVSFDGPDYMTCRDGCLDATFKDGVEDDSEVFAALGLDYYPP